MGFDCRCRDKDAHLEQCDQQFAVVRESREHQSCKEMCCSTDGLWK